MTTVFWSTARPVKRWLAPDCEDGITGFHAIGDDNYDSVCGVMRHGWYYCFPRCARHVRELP